MWLINAILAAVCFGLRGILYQWTSRKPANRNLMLFGAFLSGALAATAAALLTGQRWVAANWIGCLMGLWSFIGNASMYRGFASGKASLVALLTALPPVVVVVTAYLLWGQTLNVVQAIGFIAIIAGILMIRYSSDISLEDLKSVHWGLIALLAFGFNDTTSTQAMRWGAPVFPTMFGMFATGALLFGVSWLIEKNRAGKLPASRAHQETAAAGGQKPWRTWKTVTWGMVVGSTNFFGMYFILHAFDTGIAGLVSAVTALNVVIILIYAGVFLKERFTLKEWTGGICALAGLMTLHLAG
mgnify:CR=1 FL=1